MIFFIVFVNGVGHSASCWRDKFIFVKPERFNPLELAPANSLRGLEWWEAGLGLWSCDSWLAVTVVTWSESYWLQAAFRSFLLAAGNCAGSAQGNGGWWNLLLGGQQRNHTSSQWHGTETAPPRTGSLALTHLCGRAVVSSPGVWAAAAPVSAPQASSAVCLLFHQTTTHPIGLPDALANCETGPTTCLLIGGEEKLIHYRHITGWAQSAMLCTSSPPFF